MYRIDNDTASTTLPPVKPVGIPGYFTEGTVGGVPATIVEADWLNEVQEELLAILAAANIAPSKLVNNQVIQAILWLIGNNTRQRLTGGLNLYVNASTGSDANSGLTPTTAFATPQRAWNYIMQRLDVGANEVVVNMADGNYPGFNCSGAPVGQEGWQVVFQGNPANPVAVVISGVNQAAVSCSIGGVVVIQNMRLQSSGSGYGGYGIYCTIGGLLSFNNIDFATCTQAHIMAQAGQISAQGQSYSISGNSPLHAGSTFQGSLDLAYCDVTIYNTPTFSQGYAVTGAFAVANLGGSTFNGAAHGPHFVVNLNSVLLLNGANPNSYLPGDQAGSLGSGGVIA